MMSDKYVLGADVAQKQLRELEEEFSEAVENKSHRDAIIDAIRLGLIDFDPEQATITYRLKRPIELQNGETLESITLKEAPIEQLKQIDRGQMIKVDSTQQMEVDASVAWEKLIKTVSIVGGIPRGVVERIKRRDAIVLQALSAFFQ
jgi:hypothetical protein